MRKDVFIETSNVARFRKAMATLCDIDKGQPGFGVVQGEAGRGKTMAALNWHSLHGGIFLRVWQNWTQAAFLQALAFELTGDRPFGIQRCKLRIIEGLEEQQQPIVIDEADRLHIDRVEDLRDVHDMTGCPVIMVGEEGFHAKLHARRRIYSRITQCTEFKAVTPDDVILFGFQAAALNISPEAAHQMAKISKGSFRLVYSFVQQLEEFAKAQDCNDVDQKTLKKVNLRGRI
ncbi:MAG: AAA family ATPase [Desulfovibrio sp.]